MKNLFKILIVMSSVGLFSCQNKIELSPGLEEFNVSLEKTVFKTNEEVMFHFTGNPDMISFYSGDMYNDYAYKGGRVTDLHKTLVSFNNSYPPLANSQTSVFKVLVSTDFNNTYTYDNLTKATWQDITDQFNYSSSATAVGSGSYEVSQLYEPAKPLYFAFRYTSLPQEEHGAVRSRMMQAVQFLAESEKTTHILGDMSTSDFRIIEKSDEAKTSSTLSATTITLNRFVRTAATDPDPETDTWVVSKAFDFDKIDSGPDRAIAIKANKDPMLRSYIHVFKEPGEYMVTFIGVNANIDGYKEVLKQVKVTVEDE